MTVIAPNCWSESDQKAIREQLDRIINSAPFHQSQRRQRFLEYLVNETLAGRGERLKGYNVALEVFDRPETFDPVVDPFVRIEAARLRDKLREYYEADGQNDPIRIELPKGSYTPHIEFRQAQRPASRPDRANPRKRRGVGRRSSADHRGKFLGNAELERRSVAARQAVPCRSALRQYRGRSQMGAARRRDHRGHHHRSRPLQEPDRHRPQFHRRLQG